MRQVVVLIGGLGTRLGTTNKCFARVAGRPFLEHKLDNLRNHGATDVLLIGTRAQTEQAHLLLYREGMRVDFVAEERLGTGGSVAAAVEHLPDTFWITYGDSLTFTPRLVSPERTLQGSLALMTVVRGGPAPNVRLRRWSVRAFSDAPLADGTHTEYGMLAVRKEIFAGVTGACSLAEVLRPAVASDKVRAITIARSLVHINTPADLAAAEEFLGAYVR